MLCDNLVWDCADQLLLQDKSEYHSIISAAIISLPQSDAVDPLLLTESPILLGREHLSREVLSVSTWFVAGSEYGVQVPR